MTPYQAYRNSSREAWTRIDMLMAIYDAVIQTIEDGLQQARESEQAQISVAHQLKTQKFLLLLLEGIDVSAGSIPQDIQRLVLFAQQQIQTATIERWTVAHHVIDTLRSAFRDVRDMARRLESAGEIPALDWTPPRPTLALA